MIVLGAVVVVCLLATVFPQMQLQTPHATWREVTSAPPPVFHEKTFQFTTVMRTEDGEIYPAPNDENSRLAPLDSSERFIIMDRIDYVRSCSSPSFSFFCFGLLDDSAREPEYQLTDQNGNSFLISVIFLNQTDVKFMN